MNAAADKYLAQYAHPDCDLLNEFPPLYFDHSLVIPCFDETHDFVEQLLNTEFAGAGKTLICLVVNQPINTNSVLNKQLLNFFKPWPVLWRERNLALVKSSNPNQFWLIADYTQPGLPIKQGVGLARKMGADFIFTLAQKKLIGSPWLYCTDADAKLPKNYFSPLDKTHSAVTFAFQHLAAAENPKLTAATQIYEKALDYYSSGLRWAGSAYGFNTIGSSMAVNLKHYCLVRGFPTRSAAEDFYLLNKLAKVASVSYAPQIKIKIQSRLSHRVPFGTGPAVAKIMDLANPEKDFCYYSAKCFIALKTWQDLIPQIAHNIDAGEELIKHTERPIFNALSALNVNQILDHLKRQNTQPAQAKKALTDWFDGFKTLKCIRFLQEQYYPAEPLMNTLNNKPFNGLS